MTTVTDPHSHHDYETIRLLSQISRRIEVYKITTIYVAALLTAWLALEILGVF